jgi:tetratricopeptide (TPR) repeat protein
MPVKAGTQRQGAQAAAETTPKKRKISQTDSEKKATGVSFEVFHSEAATFQGIGEFRKAINSYTRALELRPTDKNCLIARAQCYQQLGEADKALADANETLKQDAKFVKGLLMKAEAYYQMMHFEYALMYYHRGNKLRPEVQSFRLGIQKSQEAIENSIGERAGVHLENNGDLSYFYEEQMKQQQKPKKLAASYSKPAVKTEEKIERKQQSTCTDAKTVRELLGELYTDKEYLEKLLRETESATNQSDTNKAIRTLAIQGLDYLDTRTEFWQQQKPLYSRRRDRKMRENARLQAAAEADKAKDPTQWILKKLEEIDEAQADGLYEDSLKQSKRLLKEINKWTDNDVRNRNEFLANVHSCLGNAHLEIGNYKKALTHHTTDYDLAIQHNFPDAKSRALDNLGRVHARTGNFDKAIAVWQEKLPTTKSALENTWLYHEIGRCHLEMNQPSEAREFGEKSLHAAEEAEDELWQLNASVLIAQADVKLNELDSAIDSFNRALDLARMQTDRAAENAIRRAIDDINNTIAKHAQHKARHDSAGSHSVHSRDGSQDKKSENGDEAAAATATSEKDGDDHAEDEKDSESRTTNFDGKAEKKEQRSDPHKKDKVAEKNDKSDTKKAKEDIRKKGTATSDKDSKDGTRGSKSTPNKPIGGANSAKKQEKNCR